MEPPPPASPASGSELPALREGRAYAIVKCWVIPSSVVSVNGTGIALRQKADAWSLHRARAGLAGLAVAVGASRGGVHRPGADGQAAGLGVRAGRLACGLQDPGRAGPVTAGS